MHKNFTNYFGYDFFSVTLQKFIKKSQAFFAYKYIEIKCSLPADTQVLAHLLPA